MAQALTVTVEGNPFLDGSCNAKIILDWTSAADGTVSIGICSTYAAQKPYGDSGPLPKKIRGKLAAVEFSPGALGVAATNPPTNAYDVTLLDPYSYDVLYDSAGSLGADLSNTAASYKTADEPFAIDSELTLTIANAGDSNQGRIVLYIDAMES